MTESYVHQSTASGEQILPIIANLEAALEGVKRNHAVIALLSLVLVIQKPTISQEELYEGVKQISEYICLVLEEATMAEDLTEAEMKRMLN